MNMTRSLYIHIPFCQHICGYCDFVKAKYHPLLADQVLDRIKEDLKTLNHRFKTVYCGGGTPSSLSVDQLLSLKEVLLPLLDEGCEFTMEINPETITPQKIDAIQTLGVNRISVGVQAIQVDLLKTLERHHTYDDALRVINAFRAVGIDNISVDAMYGIPNQSLADFRDTLMAFMEADLKHISLYALTIEPNTKFGRLKIPAVDNEQEGQFYELAHELLTQHGYDHYEVASFAKGNVQSQHNLTYWHYDDFIGIGPGAASKVGKQRLTNTGNLNNYIHKKELLKEEIDLDTNDQLFEGIMLGLRLSEGINLAELSQRFALDVANHFKEAIEIGQTKNWLTLEDNQLKTTFEGRLFLHDVLLLFMN